MSYWNEVKISYRAANALMNAGFDTREKVLDAVNTGELKKYRGVGAKTFNEISRSVSSKKRWPIPIKGRLPIPPKIHSKVQELSNWMKQNNRYRLHIHDCWITRGL